MAEMQEMRPFLLRGFRPEEATIRLSDHLVVAWDWSLRYGPASLIAGASVDDIRQVEATGKVKQMVGVARDGLLIDANNPWVTTESLSASESWLPENALVLELIHEKLFGLFDRIDFNRIRSHTNAATDDDSNDDLNEHSNDEAIALSIQHLAANDEDDRADETLGQRGPSMGPVRKARRIRPLRFQRLRNFLENRFGCEVQSGKGSEVKVYRGGSRIFILGHHGSNDEVHSVVVKQLLKRLDIRPQEWLQAVYG